MQRAAVSRSSVIPAGPNSSAASSLPSKAKEPSGAYPRPVEVKVFPPTKSSLTDIRFWVRVPVLSVQMTVAEPRVSTDESFFTMAFFPAILCTPSARASETVGMSPSGTLATIMPMANMKLVLKVSPASCQPRRKKTSPRPIAMKVTVFVRRDISFCRGLGSLRQACVR